MVVGFSGSLFFLYLARKNKPKAFNLSYTDALIKFINPLSKLKPVCLF